MNNKKISWIYVIKYCLHQALETSKIFTCVRVIINVLLPVNSLILSFLTMNIVNKLTQKFEYRIVMRSLIILMISCCVIKSISILYNKLLAYIIQMHNELLDRKMNLKFMDISMKADIEIFDNPDYYDRLEMAKQDSQSVIEILCNVIDLISAMITEVCIMLAIGKNEFYNAALILIAAIPSSIVMHYTTKKIYDLRCEQIDDEREKYYYSIISSEKVFSQLIRVNRIEDIIKSKYKKIWSNLHEKKKKLYKKRYIFEMIFNILPEIVCTFCIITVIHKVVLGEYTIGEYTLYNSLFAMLYSQITILITNAIKIYDNKMKLENILLINEAPNRIKSGEKNIDFIHSVEFKKVNFKYPNSEKNVLKDISFKVCKGEKIALVGENGSGKSTLIKLLFRFYDPDTGMILVNGENIKNFKIDSLRNCMDCYLQNAVNFAIPISANVDIRNKTGNYSDKRIENVLMMSNAGDIIKKCNGDLSKRVTKVFDKNGIELSEGQHQKMAISRVFFARKSFAVFDEPSSSLDPVAEDAIFSSIKELYNDRTVIFTSHRYANLYLADRIIVLNNGRIVETGTKEELMNKKAEFYRLYQCQAGKYSK